MNSLQRCVVASASRSSTANAPMTVRTTLRLFVVVVALLIGAGAGAERDAAAALPPGNTVEQWNQIAEDTVVGSGAFQIEGLIYMAYESSAVYDAVVSLQGGYQPLEPAFRVSKTASPDAAVVAAAYRTLRHYFPAAYASLDASYAEALAAIPDGPAKLAGVKIGQVAADQVIRARSVDGLTTPIGVSSSFPTLTAGAGVWRLTPPFAAAQIPWAAGVHPFVMRSAAQFLPPPPPSLSSPEWVAGFNEVKAYGGVNSSVRSVGQTNVAVFWSANVVRQYNGVVRGIVDARQLNLLQTARLAAMVNVVGADNGIATMYAKYHYLWWRPGLRDRRDGGFPGRLRPGAGLRRREPRHGRASGLAAASGDAEPSRVPGRARCADGRDGRRFTAFLGSSQINLDIHGFDPSGATGNLSAVEHFNSADDLRTEIVNARVWGGVHYRFSGLAGVILGSKVAAYDLAHAFQPIA